MRRQERKASNINSTYWWFIECTFHILTQQIYPLRVSTKIDSNMLPHIWIILIIIPSMKGSDNRKSRKSRRSWGSFFPSRNWNSISSTCLNNSSTLVSICPTSRYSNKESSIMYSSVSKSRRHSGDVIGVICSYLPKHRTIVRGIDSQL